MRSRKLRFLTSRILQNSSISTRSPSFKAKAMNPEHLSEGDRAESGYFLPGQGSSKSLLHRHPRHRRKKYMAQIKQLTGREYHPFNYYGAPDADRVIIAMGSVCQCAEEVVDYLNDRGEAVGLIEVHLYRPFSEKFFFRGSPGHGSGGRGARQMQGAGRPRRTDV